MNRGRGELIKRYLLLVLGLLFSAFGVAVTKRGELGVSPISSIPNVLSYRFPVFTLGTWLILWNCVLILAQVLMLGKEFRLIELLQIPVSLLFGKFTDLGSWLASYVPVPNYPVRLLMVLVGTGVLGFGIALTVIADVTMNPGEAVVRTLSHKTGKNFGDLKIKLDVGYVLTAIVLSLILFRLRVVGTREGTVIAALLTGVAVKFFSKLLRTPLEKLLL